MNFGPTTYGLGLLAGALSTLSPCVLPLVPVLLAAAVSAHRWGALALGAGLALSFTLVGLFLATLGASLVSTPIHFAPSAPSYSSRSALSCWCRSCKISSRARSVPRATPAINCFRA